MFLADEDSVIKKAELFAHTIFKIFDVNCIEPNRKYTLNLNDKFILRGAENYYFGFCYLSDLDVETEENITEITERFT